MNDQTTSDRSFIERLNETIARNLDNEQFGVEMLARELGVSKSQLQRKLHQFNDKSASQLIREARLKKAKELLKEGKLTVSEVAYQVGFNSPTYFSSSFHEFYGYTPGEVKNRTYPSFNKIVTSKWRITLVISIGAFALAIITYLLISNLFKSPHEEIDDSILEKSIAVFSFRNLSNNPEDQYLVEGVRESIINHLNRIGDLSIRYYSAEIYRETTKNIGELGNELQVNYILKGSYQKVGDQASLSVQLIRVNDEKYLWTKEYIEDWSDILNTQSEAAKNIAYSLKGELSAAENENILRIPTDNPEAYNLYLRGRFFWHRRTEEDLKRSIQYFNQALEIDPTYALVYAGLADSYFIMAWWGWYPSDEGYREGKKYAIKALKINDEIAEAHATLGAIATWYEWDWQEAEKELKKAIVLNPNYATAYEYYAELLDILGEKNAAREQINLALKFEPNSLMMHAVSSSLYYRNSDYEEAIEESRKTLEIRNLNSAHNRIFKCYVKLGMINEAFEYLKNMMLAETASEHQKILDEIFLDSGIDGVIKWRIEWLLINRPNDNYRIASLYGIIGEDEKAIEYLLKGMSRGERNMPRIKTDPDFSRLKSDPRFMSLLKTMHL